jgi:putative endonuclease
VDTFFSKKQTSALGARGEKAALAYLKKLGYKILETNFSNKSGRRLGEIDIIAKNGNELVFIEVKTRSFSAKNCLLPEESIVSGKLHRLNKAASFYISKNNLFGLPYRFDAITLVADPNNNQAELRHLKNIFL